MFVVSLMEDTVAVKPHEIHLDVHQVIRRRLNQRLANKVVPDLGLCLCVYDIISVGDTYILPGEGDGHTRVKFRLVVFRPFVGQVLEASVSSSNSTGLWLTLNFFEDIFIPAEKLPDPHKFEHNEQVWYWDYSADGESNKLYMDPGKTVRFRVQENVFKDVQPDLSTPVEESQRERSYQIVGSMMEHGLGCVAWWQSEADGEADEEDDMDAE